MNHSFGWHAPAPLWELALADTGLSPRRFKQPALLRFDSDGFLDDLAATLEEEPAKVADYVARAETWRDPTAGWREESEVEGEVVKAFQPAHGRFYLVAASLACRQPGLPDRKVEVAADKVSFVVRRVVPNNGFAADDPATWSEHAWVGDREKGSWTPASGLGLVDGEEQLPLAPIEFRDASTPISADERGARRRLFTGLLPVAGREVYEGSQQALGTPSADQLSTDPRGDARVAALEDRVMVAAGGLAELVSTFDDDLAHEALIFMLLDLAELLEQDVEAVWSRLGGNSSGLSPQQSTLHGYLEQNRPDLGNRSWSDLLLDTAPHRDEIFLGETPPTLVLLALGPDEIADANQELLDTGFEAIYEAALPAVPVVLAAVNGDSPPTALEGPAFYTTRVVYERLACSVLEDPTVSEPSRLFELAAFFDPDAPTRPVQIRLPVDTSIKGLRGFAQGGASFVISSQLREQLQKLENIGLVTLDEGDLNEGGPSLGLGVIWIFSIPIITLCAFILLIIIASILNIVFWWMPFLKIAIPIVVEGDS